MACSILLFNHLLFEKCVVATFAITINESTKCWVVKYLKCEGFNCEQVQNFKTAQIIQNKMRLSMKFIGGSDITRPNLKCSLQGSLIKHYSILFIWIWVLYCLQSNDACPIQVFAWACTSFMVQMCKYPLKLTVSVTTQLNDDKNDRFDEHNWALITQNSQNRFLCSLKNIFQSFYYLSLD